MSAFYAWVGGLAQRGLLPGDFQYPFLVRGFLCVLVLAPILGGVSHLETEDERRTVTSGRRRAAVAAFVFVALVVVVVTIFYRAPPRLPATRCACWPTCRTSSPAPGGRRG